MPGVEPPMRYALINEDGKVFFTLTQLSVAVQGNVIVSSNFGHSSITKGGGV